MVRVTAEVNVQHQKTKKESYDPDQQVLVKETMTNHKSDDRGAGERGGAAGVASNLPSKKTSRFRDDPASQQRK